MNSLPRLDAFYSLLGSSKLYCLGFLLLVWRVNCVTHFLKENLDCQTNAVIRNLEVIGEASKSIPEEIADSYPDISWKSMIVLRNILIHEYFGVDSEIVWEIIKSDLPKTKPFIIQILNELR